MWMKQHRGWASAARSSEPDAAAEDEEYWTMQACIMAANGASRALHLKYGFREVGIRERLGHLDGV